MENRIDYPTYQQLLHALESADITIRLRLLGEPWTKFSKLLLLSESAMILQDGSERKVIVNLRNVIELHLQQPVNGLNSNVHYEIAY